MRFFDCLEGLSTVDFDGLFIPLFDRFCGTASWGLFLQILRWLASDFLLSCFSHHKQFSLNCVVAVFGTLGSSGQTFCSLTFHEQPPKLENMPGIANIHEDTITETLNYEIECRPCASNICENTCKLNPSC